MMKYLPKNTLSFYNAAPQFQCIETAHIPTSIVAAATKKYRSEMPMVKPDGEALKFYALNHCAAVLRKTFTPNEPLPPWASEVMNAYLTEVASQGPRLLHYIMCITTREARHLVQNKVTLEQWNVLVALHGPEMKKFLLKIAEDNETQAMERYCTKPPAVPVGNYIGAVSHSFHHGKWSGGFGGDPWGGIADCAASFFAGTTSMEVMVDTGYTLQHNGGICFNKNVIYNMYSNFFQTLLDVQRSGQVPELILDTKNEYGIVIPDHLKGLIQKVKDNLPDAFRTEVDWNKVEALGSIGSYDEYKTSKAKVKKSTKKKPIYVDPEPVPMYPMDAVIDGKKVMLTGTWSITPQEEVKTYTRV